MLEVPKTMRFVAILILAVFCALGGLALFSNNRNVNADETERAYDVNTPIDILLGRDGKRQLADSIARQAYGGKSYSWDQHVAWGKELVTTGQVKQPPVGAAPSLPLSEYYRCVHCHNLVREDRRLPVQDPEAREAMIRQAAPPQPELRDGAVLSLTPGTTLWGAVNRERFYNGYYEKYHHLKLADGSAMRPDRLGDAVMICSYFCSVGRFPQDWELNSILAFLWTLELRLKDVDLAPDEAQRLLILFNRGKPDAVELARQALRRKYLAASAATEALLPYKNEDNVVYYGLPTPAKISGDARNGKFLYQSACAGCHGDVYAIAGRELAEDDEGFHKSIWHGKTHPGKHKLYMPLFTAQRLTRPQAADIRAYLRSLPKE
jgi:mono/diheme cytochrome c family protein